MVVAWETIQTVNHCAAGNVERVANCIVMAVSGDRTRDVRKVFGGEGNGASKIE